MTRSTLWRILLAALLLTIGSLVLGVGWSYYRFVTTPVELPEGKTRIELQRGTSLLALARQMAEQGIIRQPYQFVLLTYLHRDQSRLKAGEYEVVSGMTPGQILARFTSGQVIQYSLTLVEGWTFRQALAAMDAHEKLRADHLTALSDDALMAALGRGGEHPEGRFFPDTYQFTARTSAIDILRRALDRMDHILAEEWEQRRPGLPIATPYEALILASIVEKETGVPSERARIAGVFVRRLQKGMRLQTDPTVIYGLGTRYDGNIRSADLREATPYNTYVITGLPPTPIALPGRDAIRAALQPAPGDSLYFVARGDGTHEFSPTLDAHNRAVRRFILSKP